MTVDARAVASAVETCADVAELSGGAVAEVATYLPGERVLGVRETADGIEIHIVARWGRPLPQIAEQVQRVVQSVTGPARVCVVIDDIEDPPEPAPRLRAAG
jgi:hypothetical protein